MKANPVLLCHKYASVVKELAAELNIPLSRALAYFYGSETYQLMREGVSDMHCLSDGYLAEEIFNELRQ